jgi:outer membrane usher protein FimD/PapC
MIPIIESSIALNYNKLFTNYVESSVAGIRVSKNMFDNFADLSFSYRRSDYKLTTSDFTSIQNIFSIDVSARFSRAVSLSVSYEGVFEKERTSGRIFAGVTTRF